MKGSAPVKSVFVTGSTGFVGAHLVRLLLEKGIRVKALVREGSDTQNIDGLDLERVRGDLLDGGILRSALEGCDACFHLAAAYRAVNPADLYRANVNGTMAILEAARDAGVGVTVHTSTMGTLRPRPGSRGMLREEDSGLGEGASDYVRSKFQGEQAAAAMAEAGVPVVIVHPSAPVGAWDRVPTVTGQRILSVLQGRVPGYLEGAINHVPARDVAEGMILAARKGRTGAHYLLASRGGNLSRRRFLRLVARTAGIPVPRTGRLKALKRLVGHRRGPRSGPATLACDPTRSIRELALPQTSLEDAFCEAVEWFRRRGMV